MQTATSEVRDSTQRSREIHAHRMTLAAILIAAFVAAACLLASCGGAGAGGGNTQSESTSSAAPAASSFDFGKIVTRDYEQQIVALEGLRAIQGMLVDYPTAASFTNSDKLATLAEAAASGAYDQPEYDLSWDGAYFVGFGNSDGAAQSSTFGMEPYSLDDLKDGKQPNLAIGGVFVACEGGLTPKELDVRLSEFLPGAEHCVIAYQGDGDDARFIEAAYWGDGWVATVSCQSSVRNDTVTVYPLGLNVAGEGATPYGMSYEELRSQVLKTYEDGFTQAKTYAR